MSAQRMRDVREDEVHDHDRGLPFDVSRLMSRRRALQLAAVGGLATLVGCGTSAADSAATTDAATTTAAVTGEIPQETGGPYPADGSNGVNVLTESGIVRGDITSSFGSASGTAQGVPLAIALTVLDVSTGGTPAEGAAVDLWHCDRDGRYSMYSSEIADENYLRRGAGGRRRPDLPADDPADGPHDGVHADRDARHLGRHGVDDELGQHRVDQRGSTRTHRTSTTIEAAKRPSVAALSHPRRSPSDRTTSSADRPTDRVRAPHQPTREGVRTRDSGSRSHTGTSAGRTGMAPNQNSHSHAKLSRTTPLSTSPAPQPASG